MWFEWTARAVTSSRVTGGAATGAAMSEGAVDEQDAALPTSRWEVGNSWPHRVSLGAPPLVTRGSAQGQVSATVSLEVAMLLQNAERWRSSYTGDAVGDAVEDAAGDVSERAE